MPECRSLQCIIRSLLTGRFVPNLVMDFAKIGLIDKEYYCDNCHYTWPKGGTKRSILYPERKPYRFVDGIEQTMLRPELSKAELRSVNRFEIVRYANAS